VARIEHGPRAAGGGAFACGAPPVAGSDDAFAVDIESRSQLWLQTEKGKRFMSVQHHSTY
jgi:hypothetical protein